MGELAFLSVSTARVLSATRQKSTFSGAAVSPLRGHTPVTRNTRVATPIAALPLLAASASRVAPRLATAVYVGAAGVLSRGYVSLQPVFVQFLWFLGIAAIITQATRYVNTKLHLNQPQLIAKVVGVLFLYTGYMHFASLGVFLDVFPPPGTWGVFYLPFSPEFHVKWTGLAEMAGGVGLLLGDREFAPRGSQQTAARSLALLTAAVTPANIYMFTHDKLGPMLNFGRNAIPWYFHFIRLFLLQPLLIATLSALARKLPERA